MLLNKKLYLKIKYIKMYSKVINKLNTFKLREVILRVDF